MATVPPDDGFHERYYSSQDGLRLYFRDYGDALAPGVTAVCLAGFARNSRDFHRLARRLGAGRRLLCPDYRGRGRSAYDRQWRNYEPRTYLDDIRHLLALTNTHRAVFIGTSLGGFLAAGMSVAAPGAVAGVILNDVGPEIDQRGLERILAYLSADRPQPDWDGAVRFLKEAFPGLAFASESAWLELARNTYRLGADGRLHFDWDVNITRSFAAGRARDLWPLFRALGTMPTVALRGERSDILSAATLERMAHVKPDLACVTVSGVGHAPTLDEPEARAAIDSFLASLDERERH
ncbi:MAG: alpha/beta fold hydrolase [Alphaproteobacteria bacterium]